MKIICEICENEITKGERILAFGEFIPDDYQWKDIDINDGFDEVIPEEDGWQLAHFWCIFKKKEGKNEDNKNNS